MEKTTTINAADVKKLADKKVKKTRKRNSWILNTTEDAYLGDSATLFVAQFSQKYIW